MMRDFQQETLEKLKNKQSSLVVAPTGIGKTRATLLPFVNSLHDDPLLGSRLIYSLPLRVLTKGVEDELKALLGNHRLPIAIHHGEEPESRIFSERACITTIDQYLTAFAGAPLSFAMNSGHAVAGAILTSYSAFDEVHLLSPEKGLPLLFAILKLRQRWGLLSAVSTATLPNSIIEYFTKNLGLEVIRASDSDIQERDSWRKVKIQYDGQLEEKDFLDLVYDKFKQVKEVSRSLRQLEHLSGHFDVVIHEKLNLNYGRWLMSKSL